MPGSPSADVDRPLPLDAAALTRTLVRPGSVWTEIRVVTETGSTNDDVAALARDGAAAGLVLVAESQTAGRGRLARSWIAPARSGLTFSALLRPASVAVDRWGWLPLLSGVAVVSALRQAARIDVRLKWPNDVLVNGGKLAGILGQRIEPDAAVVGIGLNVTARARELPPGATSLIEHDAATTERETLLRAILRELAQTYEQWVTHDGDPDSSRLGPRYADLCSTLGRTVRVDLPGGAEHTGHADGVDSNGRLVVDGRPFSAGDVVHVR